jgi:hypothetical protein
MQGIPGKRERLFGAPCEMPSSHSEEAPLNRSWMQDQWLLYEAIAEEAEI